MVLKYQFAIGGTHLLIGGCRKNFQNFVGSFQGVAAQVEHGFHFFFGQSHIGCHFFQRFYLFAADVVVAPGYVGKESQQLQAFLVCEVGGYLPTAITDGLSECERILHVHSLALLEEVEQYPFTFAYCRNAEVGP